MVKTSSNKSAALTLEQTVDSILAAEKLTPQEYVQLTSALLSDYQLTDELRHQINHIFDQILQRRIKILP